MELKTLSKMRDFMSIDEQGILKVTVTDRNNRVSRTLCPIKWRTDVVQAAHLQAHLGINKTIQRIKLNWFWPNMTSEVRRFVKSCEICQKSKKGGTRNDNPGQKLYAGRPWQTLAIDLVGPLPETARRNKWILTVTDHFTRWQEAFPIVDATMPTIAEVLEERIFCPYGLPERLHSDQGAQFEGELMFQLWGIKKSITTPYHPQGNGIVERGNRTIGDSLRALLINRTQDEWDRFLPQIMKTLRASPHASTGETANMMMFGRELRLPDQILCPTTMDEAQERATYVEELQKRLEVTHEIIRQQQVTTRQQNTDESLLFLPGDQVLLENRRRRKGENPKLQSKFVGPYQVIEAFPNHTYAITSKGQHSIQNESRLKLFRESTHTASQTPGEIEGIRRPNMKGAVKRSTNNRQSQNVEQWLVKGSTDDQIAGPVSQDQLIDFVPTPPSRHPPVVDNDDDDNNENDDHNDDDDKDNEDGNNDQNRDA